KTLSCGADSTIALYFNDDEITGEVKCTRDGWYDGANVLSHFKPMPPSKLPYTPNVECREFCSKSLINKANCPAGAICREHIFSDEKLLSCGTDDTVALFLNGEERTGVLKCTRDGWTQTVNTPAPGTPTIIVPFKAQTTPVNVYCREWCAPSLIDTQDMTNKYSTEKKLSCGFDETVALFVDEQPTKGEVQCTRDGWIEKGTQPK
ncbi:hypothetical protein PMAYCL1PPCAC_19431, partial [Pristionchus mayeri]